MQNDTMGLSVVLSSYLFAAGPALWRHWARTVRRRGRLISSAAGELPCRAVCQFGRSEGVRPCGCHAVSAAWPGLSRCHRRQCASQARTGAVTWRLSLARSAVLYRHAVATERRSALETGRVRGACSQFPSLIHKFLLSSFTLGPKIKVATDSASRPKHTTGLQLNLSYRCGRLPI